MLIAHNRLVPFKDYDAINILGTLLCRKETAITVDLIQHERIYTRRMIELGSVSFYLFYVIERLTRLPVNGRTYPDTSFECEVCRHTDGPNYLLNRRPYAWTRYLKDPSKSRTKSSKKSN